MTSVACHRLVIAFGRERGVLGGMGCLRMMILPISKDQISANSNPFLISEDDICFLTVE